METERNALPSSATAHALERKLVTMRQITEIRRPWKLWIQRMMIATVSGGWSVVLRSRDFKVGDHILYFECDSFIPATAVKFGREMRGLLEDLDGERGYHIRERTVCGHISQGHIMAIEDFYCVRHIVNVMKEEFGPEEGLRVASMMAIEGVIGVKKWEAQHHAHSA